jgi:hypothetical protein
MEFLQYMFRFLYRIRWWLIIAPLLVVLIVIIGTRDLERSYPGGYDHLHRYCIGLCDGNR